MNKWYPFLVVLALFACDVKQEPTIAKDLAAKVYEYTLTNDELKSKIATTDSKVDSIRISKQYIQEWAKKKLLYRNAIINLDKTDELDRMVDEYKEELYVSYYKNALVNKKLDTLVFQKEIDSFYVHNKANFKLGETLIKFKYIHLAPEQRKRKTVRKLFLSGKPEDQQKLLEAYKTVDDYSLNDSVWVSLKDVYVQKPEFPTLTQYQLSKEKILVETKLADRSYYLIYIQKVLNIGDVAPLPYVEKTIKSILLHKNKMKFFNQMEQILIDDAVKQKKYEVY
ncbi:hypothetical protein [Wenyingzhuangia sp. IMCC45574]